MTYKESIYRDICELIIDFEEGYIDSTIELGGGFSISLCDNGSDFQDWEIVLYKNHRKVHRCRFLNSYSIVDILTGERDHIEDMTTDILKIIKKYIEIKDEEEIAW